MKPTFAIVSWIVLTVFYISGISTIARGAFIFSVQQSPQGVTVTGAGTLNLTSLSLLRNGEDSAEIDANAGLISAGPVSLIANSPISVYSGISMPSALGQGGPVAASSGSGDSVGIANYLSVPEGYLSGTPLNDTAIFNFATFAQLGLTPGLYVSTWGSGPTADSLTINIGTVPEPMTLGVLAVPASLALLRRRRGLR